MAAVLVLAAIPKITAPHDFARAIYHYQLLLDIFINPVAIILPWLELVVAGALLLRRWYVSAATLTLILLIVFLVAEASAYFRGLNIACGCFSVDADASPLTIWSLLRDGGLLLVSLMIVLLWRRTTVPAVPAVGAVEPITEGGV